MKLCCYSLYWWSDFSWVVYVDLLFATCIDMFMIRTVALSSGTDEIRNFKLFDVHSMYSRICLLQLLSPLNIMNLVLFKQILIDMYVNLQLDSAYVDRILTRPIRYRKLKYRNFWFLHHLVCLMKVQHCNWQYIRTQIGFIHISHYSPRFLNVLWLNIPGCFIYESDL